MKKKYKAVLALSEVNNADLVGLSCDENGMSLALNFEEKVLSFGLVCAFNLSTIRDMPEKSSQMLDHLQKDTIYVVKSDWAKNFNDDRTINHKESGASDHKWWNDENYIDQFSSIENLNHYYLSISGEMHLNVLATSFKIEDKDKTSAIDLFYKEAKKKSK